MTFSETYLGEACIVLASIDHAQVDALAVALAQVREHGGRVFLLGLGGSAAHASHAAADFRKLCGLDAICLTDNMAAFTAAANDTNWSHSFHALLVTYRWGSQDALLILSVGGGSGDVSAPLGYAMVASSLRSDLRKVLAIVGRDGGDAARFAQVCVRIPPTYPDHVTPHTEGLMSVVLHCLVSHPALQVQKPKWESLS